MQNGVNPRGCSHSNPGNWESRGGTLAHFDMEAIMWGFHLQLLADEVEQATNGTPKLKPADGTLKVKIYNYKQKFPYRCTY